MSAQRDFWTASRVETLRRLWLEGLTARECALAIGDGCTRNAVIGKLARLGLSERKERDRARMALASLANDTCRWPIGEPDDDGFHFCGAPTADLAAGNPYCPTHHRIAYQPSMAGLKLTRDARAGTVKAERADREPDLVEALA